MLRFFFDFFDGVPKSLWNFIRQLLWKLWAFNLSQPQIIYPRTTNTNFQKTRPVAITDDKMTSYQLAIGCPLTTLSTEVTNFYEPDSILTKSGRLINLKKLIFLHKRVSTGGSLVQNTWPGPGPANMSTCDTHTPRCTVCWTPLRQPVILSQNDRTGTFELFSIYTLL